MARKPQDNPQLDMTPMIDVVFELIIFFVVTIKQEDILSKLNVNRPATPEKATPKDNDDEVCEIQVGDYRGDSFRRRGVYVIGDAQNTQRKEVELKDVRVYLEGSVIKRRGRQKVSEIPVVVKCHSKSNHGALIELLDMAYELGLRNINVFTL